MLTDMRPEDAAGPAVEHHIRYHDGSTRTVYITDIETQLPEGKLIVSRTDPDGTITFMNQAFIDMSGWSGDELIGAPHSILRHPDLPAAAFADLWTTVQAGEKWRGYVKNLRKDGGFYWVYATVIPNIRMGKIVGYTSVRRKPSRSKVKECISLYSSMLLSEATS